MIIIGKEANHRCGGVCCDKCNIDNDRENNKLSSLVKSHM